MLLCIVVNCFNGLQGFNPDDFQRGPGQLHPDLAQPGPGMGADWDTMFG